MLTAAARVLRDKGHREPVWKRAGKGMCCCPATAEMEVVGFNER